MFPRSLVSASKRGDLSSKSRENAVYGRMTVSLRWLIIVTLLSGLWLYAFLIPWYPFVPYAFLIVMVAVVVGLTLAIISLRKRPFWTGFTTATTTYALLTLPPFAFESTRRWIPQDQLIEKYVSYKLDEIAEAREKYMAAFVAAKDAGQPQPPPPPLVEIDRKVMQINIFFIGHAWFALLFGVLCGLFAAWYRRREDAERSDTR